MTDNERFDLILAAIQGMKTDIQEMKTDMQDMKTEMKDMKADMQGMKTDIQDMKGSIHRLEQRVKTIEVNLENVTNRNIQLIAEGHLDLVRKLEEAVWVKEERELLLTRVNVLEGDMRRVKQQLALA